MAKAFDNLAPRVMRDLIADFDLTAEQAAGVVGNLGAESGLQAIQEAHPLIAGSRGGFGFAQWTGDRRIAFERFASAHQLSLLSYDANYGYLKAELSGNAGRFDFRHTIEQLKKTTTVQAAVETFESFYEKAGVKAIISRVTFAKLALSLYDRSVADPPKGSPKMPQAPAPSPIPAPGKPWYESKAVIGGLLAIVLPLASAAFPALKLVDPNTAADTVMKVIQVIGPVVGGALAIFGRIKAVEPIAGTQAAQIVAGKMLDAQRPAQEDIVAPTMMTLPFETILSELPTVIEALDQLSRLARSASVQNANLAGAPVTPTVVAASFQQAGE